MRIKSLFYLFVIYVSFFTYIPQAQAGWLDFLFPAPEQTGPSPSETLRAPFADEDAVIEDMDSFDNLSNSAPLDQRHRTNTVMIGWVQVVLPQLLSYQTDGYENQYKEKIGVFSKSGLDEYIKFLHDMNYITTLKTGRYDITGFIQDYPVVVNEGVVDGRYLWLIQANVMVTFMEKGMDSYLKENSSEGITQEYVVTFQVGRVKEIKNEHGVLIESWNIRKK